MATSSSSSAHAVPEGYKNIRMVTNESVEDEELQMKWRCNKIYYKLGHGN
jgi:hypothetical protein